jgi:hypothetical protein
MNIMSLGSRTTHFQQPSSQDGVGGGWEGFGERGGGGGHAGHKGNVTSECSRAVCPKCGRRGGGATWSCPYEDPAQHGYELQMDRI